MKRGLILFIVVVVLTLLYLASSVLAVDTDLQDPCSTNEDCVYLCRSLLHISSDCYCNQGSCFIRGANTTSGGASNNTASLNTTSQNTTVKNGTIAPSVNYATSAELNVLKSDLASVKQSLASVEGSVISLESDSNGFNAQLSSLQESLQQTAQSLALQERNLQSLREELGLEIQAVATGLAGLQNTLDQTQSEVSTLEGTVAEKPGLGGVVISLIIIIAIVVISLGLWYYVEKLKHPGVNLGDTVVDYINRHIKSGKKFHHIQGEMLKAGWKHDEIKNAYQTTARNNYQNYLKNKSSTPGQSSMPYQSSALNQSSMPNQSPGLNQSSMPQPPQGLSFNSSEKAKIAVIAVISILLISGVVFLLSTSSGQAIYLKKGILDTGEVVHGIECTPPHILTPDGDACCLDENANSICDLTEERETGLSPSESQSSCTDSLQCPSGQSCIDKKCQTIDELYQGSPICDKQCIYYSTRVLTSDGETYYLQPGKGSYTAAGALEWKLLPMPKHCNGEDAIIPVKLIRKNQGRILGEEVITLHRGETSMLITHQQIPSIKFTLTVDEVYEVCE